MDEKQFVALLKPAINIIAGKPVDQALAAELNRRFPADGGAFKAIEAACHAAIKAGWMCSQGAPGRRFGRVTEPGPESQGLSIDVVLLEDFAGPHHSHPKGEICLTMPVTPEATFDGGGAGWSVNEPGSTHRPTVAGGEALVLYLLPDGEIVFTK